MSKHRIVSYNVLSSHLSPPDYYTACDPENLKPENRLEKIFAKLSLEIANQSIICLQEISTLWAGEFHRFFLSNNYYFITGLYGKPHNGYMGVGLAFPMNKYSLQAVNIERIADTRKWPKISSLELWLRNFLQQTVRKLGIKSVHLENPFDYAKSRFNQWIFTTLKDQETQEIFSVATYHMPCVFFVPQVMTLHAALVVKRIQELAKNEPFVLAGDFNITPENPQYQLITTGFMDSNNPAYPSEIDDNFWELKLDVPLRSAYKEALGKEPELTNYSQVKNKATFISTLDYIWLSPQWEVISVLSLPNKEEAAGPFPNNNEPSDHLLIAADLTIKTV